MKVLLTGATGQVGLEIIKTQPESVEIIQPNRNQLNLSDYDSCKKIVEETKPDWIINCGAYTAVDAAENDIEICTRINSYAPKAFTKAINETNGKLLQLSTDFVFDGEQNTPYKDNHEKNPLCHYGKSKSLGEELIKNNVNNIKNSVILRTSWVISPRGRNFVKTILNANKIKEKTINLIKKNGFFEYYSFKTGKAFGASNFSWTASLFLDLTLENL